MNASERWKRGSGRGWKISYSLFGPIRSMARPKRVIRNTSTLVLFEINSFFVTPRRRDLTRNILQSDEIKKIEIKFKYVRLWSDAFVMTSLKRKKSFGSLVKMLMEDQTFIYLFSMIKMMGQWQSVFLSALSLTGS